MKKSKLSLGLVTSFVAALALAGCSDVKAADNSLLTFKGYDGSVYDIATDKMYDEYRKDNSVISTFYDKVLEVLIRDRFQAGLGEELQKYASKDYQQIEDEAKVDVQAAKAKATESAKSNKTKYETEWDAILSSEGVEDEDELLQKYIYNKEKAVLEDALYASLTEKTDDKLKKEWIEGAHPYHIRHILAKVESGASDYTRGAITSDQAIKLSNIGLALGLSNDTFGGVAFRLSEDEGSGKLYGDVGTTTVKASESGSFSMVTEFQLAIYIYDALYAGKDISLDTYKDLIPDSVPSTASEPATAFESITKVPYEVFQLLASEDNGGYGDVTKNNSKIVGQGEEVVYPRNILWNKYLNHHEPFVITNESVADQYGTVKYNLESSIANIKTFANDAKADWTQVNVNATGDAIATIADRNEGATGFKRAGDLTEIPALATKLGADTKILVDENNNPIFGVRSEYGIHFIIIQKSAFESTETLAKWYQVYSPKQADYPTEGGTQITSYVNYAKFDDDQMSARASAIKDAIKGFDGSYQYRIYEELKQTALAENRFNVSEDNDAGKKAKELLDSIDSYIALQKEKNAYDQEVGYELAWDNFMLKFDEQTAERAKDQRVVPWVAAIGFKKGVDLDEVKDLYAIGGSFYYGDKAQ